MCFRPNFYVKLIFQKLRAYPVLSEACIFLIFSPFAHRVPVLNPHISRCLFARCIDRFVTVVTVDRRPNDMPSTRTKRRRNPERRFSPIAHTTRFRSPSKIEDRRQKALHRNSLSILRKKGRYFISRESFIYLSHLCHLIAIIFSFFPKPYMLS